MELPSVPTDNLYKFMALSGLAIVITSFYLFFSRADALNERFYAVAQRKGIVDSKLQELKSQIEKNMAKADELKASLKPGMTPKEYERIFRENDVLGEDNTKTSVELLTYSNEIIEVAAAAAINDEILSLQKRQRVGFAVLQGFGMLVSICGFALWYSRVQRYLDIQLAREAQTSAMSAGA